MGTVDKKRELACNVAMVFNVIGTLRAAIVEMPTRHLQKIVLLQVGESHCNSVNQRKIKLLGSRKKSN